MGDVPLTEAEEQALAAYAVAHMDRVYTWDEPVTEAQVEAAKAEAVRRIRAAERERVLNELRGKVWEKCVSYDEVPQFDDDYEDEPPHSGDWISFAQVLSVLAALGGTEGA